MKHPYLFLLCFFVIAFPRQSKSQTCTGCTLTISGYDTLAYTVNSGQTLCIDTMGVFAGTLTLNGGTVCNKGFFNPASLVATAGTISNYSNVQISTDLTLSSSLTWFNGGQSVAMMAGNLSINGGSFNNAGITTVVGNITFSSGSLINSAILNCQALSGTGVASISNSGIINDN